MAVNFWDLDHPSRNLAVLAADGRKLTYGELRDACGRFAPLLASAAKSFGFVVCRNTPECLIAYLSALRSGSACCLLDAGIQSEIFEEQLATYEPDWVFAMEDRSITGYTRQAAPDGFFYFR